VILFVDRDNVIVMTLWYHLVLEFPTSAAGKFSDNDIAVTKEVDIEVDVVNRLERELAWERALVLGVTYIS
jgi:hypothetical protein